MKIRLITTVIYTTKAVVKLKSKKNPGFNGFQTYDLSDTGALLYQANWEQVTLRVQMVKNLSGYIY